MDAQNVDTIVKTVTWLAVIFVTGYAIPWLKRHIKSRKLDQLLTIGNIVVSAVEQEAKVRLITIPKKQAAIARMQAWANDVGIHVTSAQINDVIESGVLALDLKKPTVAKSSPSPLPAATATATATATTSPVPAT